MEKPPKKWEKGGPSPNPGGRPKGPLDLRRLYDENKDDVRLYARLWEIIKQDDDIKATLKAIELLWERRYGKAPLADEEGKLAVEIETLKAKLELLKAGHDPDGPQITVVIPEALKRDGE